LSLEELENLSKHIDIRLRGTFEVYAKTRDEAAEKVRKRILDEVLVKHPSFRETGLPDHWEEWLEQQTSKMLGIEVVEEDEIIEEEVDISWSNVKGGRLYKDGIEAYRRKTQ